MKRMKKIFVGFDFSMNKPACTLIMDNKIKFLIWPLSMKTTVSEIYKQADVRCVDRNLPPMSKKSMPDLTSSSMTLEHTKRSVALAKMIVDDIFSLTGSCCVFYVSSEGLSFASHGTAAMDLATYKGVLLAEVYTRMKPVGLYTYSPISIKKVAGCSDKAHVGDKHAMIKAFLNEKEKSGFFDVLSSGALLTSTGKNYLECVDDIVDSYWACKTMYFKEDVDGIPMWDLKRGIFIADNSPKAKKNKK